MPKSSDTVERTTISLSGEAMTAGKRLASKRNMKFSNLIEELLKDAADAGDQLPAPTDPDCVIKLAERFCPTYVPEMRERCRERDQPKTLEAVLKLFATGGIGLSDEFLKGEFSKAAEGAAPYPLKDSPPK